MHNWGFPTILFTSINNESGLAFSSNTGRVDLHGLGDLGFLCSLARGLQKKKIHQYSKLLNSSNLGLGKPYLCTRGSWFFGCLLCLLGLLCSSEGQNNSELLPGINVAPTTTQGRWLAPTDRTDPPINSSTPTIKSIKSRVVLITGVCFNTPPHTHTQLWVSIFSCIIFTEEKSSWFRSSSQTPSHCREEGEKLHPTLRRVKYKQPKLYFFFPHLSQKIF